MTDSVELPAGRAARGSVVAPPSKSHAIRLLICAALANRTFGALGGRFDVAVPARVAFKRGPLPEDVARTLDALQSLGFPLRLVPGPRPVVEVTPGLGCPPRESALLDVGGSGTALRFLAAVCALGPGPYTITGTPQLLRRPAGAIVPALRALGVSVKGECGGHDGVRPPLVIAGGPARGGAVDVDASESSHVVSAMLLVGPALEDGIHVAPTGRVASRPYVDLTIRTMRDFGADVLLSATGWTTSGDRGYSPNLDRVDVDGDWSSAAFLLGAAAATGGDVVVEGLPRASAHPDGAVTDVLVKFGAAALATSRGTRCTGRVSRPVDVDLRDAPDLAPLVGALACLVPGTSRVRGAAHLRIKESDRIAEVVRCARALGCDARELPDGFEITGPAKHGAAIDPAGDHRLAMAFAVAGLAVPGTSILDPGCVAKSYPAFWDDLRVLVGEMGPPAAAT